MKPDRVSGTVSLRKPVRDWLSNRSETSALVHLSGIETFALSFQFQQALFQNIALYQLSDLNGHVIQSWHFDFTFTKKTLDISIQPNFPLLYQRGFFGKSSFLTRTEKQATFMSLKNDSRSYHLEDMKFIHRDYQSQISFNCPEERLIQGILVASLLFEPPLFAEND